ncbi:hypothetical protein LY78DRAFT_226007 [Colletotrichum sublineola]|nr:hypothetical protein LY78DRAFT_226007 [Colletotrichum sublineola]
MREGILCLHVISDGRISAKGFIICHGPNTSGWADGQSTKLRAASRWHYPKPLCWVDSRPALFNVAFIRSIHRRHTGLTCLGYMVDNVGVRGIKPSCNAKPINVTPPSRASTTRARRGSNEWTAICRRGGDGGAETRSGPAHILDAARKSRMRRPTGGMHHNH